MENLSLTIVFDALLVGAALVLFGAVVRSALADSGGAGWLGARLRSSSPSRRQLASARPGGRRQEGQRRAGALAARRWARPASHGNRHSAEAARPHPGYGRP